MAYVEPAGAYETHMITGHRRAEFLGDRSEMLDPRGVDRLRPAQRKRDRVREDGEPEPGEGLGQVLGVEVLGDDLDPVDTRDPGDREVELRPPTDPHTELPPRVSHRSPRRHRRNFHRHKNFRCCTNSRC